MGLKRTIGVVVCSVALSSGAIAESHSVAKIYEKRGAFEDVRQDVADAIINRGFVIDYTARIGEMLRRTGKDLGAEKEVYTAADAIHFCSAKLSREMVEADPANIVLCPYILVVYELAGKPGIVHVAYRRMPVAPSERGKKALAGIEKVLDEIASKATR
jgi:uncharacterized protein (DUF302 family)